MRGKKGERERERKKERESSEEKVRGIAATFIYVTFDFTISEIAVLSRSRRARAIVTPRYTRLTTALLAHTRIFNLFNFVIYLIIPDAKYRNVV